MLSDLQKSTLEHNLNSILSIPDSITQKEYMEIYNCIYLYSTEYTEDYKIRGEPIYSILSQKIENFGKNLQFNGSISTIASQIRNFELTISLLEKIFSYLERFYIKISILNNKDVKKIKDLFLYKIYYHFIYKIEENLTNIIFLEIETLRKFYKQNFTDLATIIEFYLGCLINNDLTTNILSFCDRYISEFKNCFNFNAEISKLLKKIYFEMFFATTVINNRNVNKEIINTILFRKDEIMSHVFEKIVKFEKFKHIYVIINMMPDNCKNIFRSKYEIFLNDILNNSHSFIEIYQNYCKVTDQIVVNKLNSFNDVVEECFRKSFFERSTVEQLKIYKEMVDFIHNYIINTYYYKDLLDKLPSSLKIIKISSDSNNINYNIKADEENIELTLFDLFSLISDERLIDLYTKSVQKRLLKGMNSIREEEFVELICDRLDWSLVSILKKCISEFTNRLNYSFNIKKNNNFTVTCSNTTKCFWGIDKYEPKLHSSLEVVKQRVSGSINIPDRHIHEFNFSVSPLIFSMNNTYYRMATSIASLLFYIVDDNGIEYEELKIISADNLFDQNIEFLIKNEFIKLKNEENGSKTIYLTIKSSDEPLVDLFSVPENESIDSEPILDDIHIQYILESKLCKIMKKNKEMNYEILKEEFKEEVSEFELAIGNLVSKGYLTLEDSLVKYNP